MADSPIISATDNDRLCDCCRFVISVRCENIYYPHHQSEAALGKSASDCPLCFTLWLAYSEKKYGHGAGADMEFVTFKFRLSDGSRELDMLKGRSARTIKFHFRAVFSNDPPPHSAEQDSAGEGNEETALANIIAVPVKAEDESILRASSGNTSSKETWSIVSRWLHQCAFSHSECRQNSISEWMPTRVIDVGTPHNPHLRLHITNSGSPASPYAAVSHCWGGVQNVKQLREANLHSMTHEIKLNELPWSFRDAITVTRRIGLQYLWIDSLCIIQDSLKDWTMESSKMGEVYKNCLVNISATAAPNGDSGCFFPRNPARARTCRAVIERAAKGNVIAKSRTFNLVSSQVWNDSIYKEPLAKRGWVLQEQFLAPRILHFSRYQVFYECQQLNACEMFPNGIPCAMRGGWRKSLLPYYQKNRLMLNLAKVEAEFISNKIVDAHAVWITTLRLYTRCHLTEERDKLVAVSAIAREIQPIIQDEYLAGLWRRYLPFQLLWFVHHPPAGDRIPVRSKDYCAPTWSWASLNANIEADLDTLKEGRDFMIKILEARVEATSSDIFGQISSGYLRVRGWMRGFCMGKRTRFPWSLYVPGGGLVTAFFDEPQNSENGLWYCLPVMEGLDYRNHLKITGLILEKTGNDNTYRRAGIFHASTRYPGDKRLHDFRRPSYSFHLAKAKEKASEISGTSRGQRKNRSRDMETDGLTATSQSPVFKWDAGGRNLGFGHASSGKNSKVAPDPKDWFFFPDSVPKQDNVRQPPVTDERDSHIADTACHTGSPRASLERSTSSAESKSDKQSRKRQREEEELDSIHPDGNEHPDLKGEVGSSSVSSEEFSDGSDEDADDGAIEELTPEEQESKMKEEWVECIITII